MALDVDNMTLAECLSWFLRRASEQLVLPQEYFEPVEPTLDSIAAIIPQEAYQSFYSGYCGTKVNPWYAGFDNLDIDTSAENETLCRARLAVKYFLRADSDALADSEAKEDAPP